MLYHKWKSSRCFDGTSRRLFQMERIRLLNYGLLERCPLMRKSTLHVLRGSNWDYRRMEYPAHAKTLKHPCDQSLATYRGHAVLRTLICCYFSPEYSTGQKYIYTGSSDCSIYIYDLVSGVLVATLDHHEELVRDCSWHPLYPMIISSSWDWVIARWEFRAMVKHLLH